MDDVEPEEAGSRRVRQSFDIVPQISSDRGPMSFQVSGSTADRYALVLPKTPPTIAIRTLPPRDDPRGSQGRALGVVWRGRRT